MGRTKKVFGSTPITKPILSDRSVTSRQVLTLALPAFFTLTAEPLFLMCDAAIIGHLGVTSLAGFGLASTVLTGLVGLFVFLAYGTTATVARHTGAGLISQASQRGIDGGWLSLFLGLLVGVTLAAGAVPITAVFGAPNEVTEGAVTYLRFSALGLPGMFVALAASGVLRGFRDTWTPLVVAMVGFAVNAVANALLVYGTDLGIVGSALGTAAAHTGMGSALAIVVIRKHRRLGGTLCPRLGAIWNAAHSSVPLLVRTVGVRGAVILTAWVAVSGGEITLAAYHVSATVWTFFAFALDGLAIAAQALIGHALGAGDRERARAVTKLLTTWGIGSGVAFGGLLIASHRVLPDLFTGDPALHDAIAGALLIVGIHQPLCGLVFALDGILIGAGDHRFLGIAMIGSVLLYLPIALVVRSQPATPTSVWWAFIIFMTARALMMQLRAGSSRWMRLGVSV
ncbi:MAG: MATE family efflux transporter [Actinomycetota bacterium]